MKRLSIFLIMVALIAGTVGCGDTTPAAQYELTMAVAPAGSGNATDLTNASPYTAGTAVNITAVAAVGYQFVNWTAPGGAFANANAAQTTFAMPARHVTVTANFAPKAVEIRTWYDLAAMRHNLAGSYRLMNDLDSTTAGHNELASPTANDGKGWEPVGTSNDQFTGTLDGQGYEIRNLLVNRPDDTGVGLFGFVDVAGAIENVRVVNGEVTGYESVGGLVGQNGGIVSNSYSMGTVTAERERGNCVGGLVGHNEGTVSNSYSTGTVTVKRDLGNCVGGLVGENDGTVTDSYSTGSVTGDYCVGGLVGENNGTVSNSYSRGNVTGGWEIGGLVGDTGWSGGTVSNSYYNYDAVLINGEHIITIGALFKEDFAQWLANDKFLDVNQRLSREDGYYLIDDVSDFKQLLAFGQDSSLKFKLENDLSLATEPSFYIPYLAGEFDGNSHIIWDLNFNFFVQDVGLFGYLAYSGKVNKVAVQNVNITGRQYLGGLVGWNGGTVNNSYSTGSVTALFSSGGLVGWNGGTVSNSHSTASVGAQYWVGGLVGENNGIVSNSYSTGNVTGESDVGGLVGMNYWNGTVGNSHYNYDEVLINGRNVITIGALFNEDFEQWLANGKFLDANERLSQEDGYYVISDVSDFKQLLAFGQDDSLKFRLEDDLDLVGEPDFYIPYLAGEFDGNGHRISGLNLNFDFMSQVGLFGYLASGAKVTGVGVENANITGAGSLGGLVGWNEGAVSNSYSMGAMTGGGAVGGLVGDNEGTVSNSYSTGSISGEYCVGGLMGRNWGTVSNSHSTSSVTGVGMVGGLMGFNRGTVSDSYSVGSVTGSDRVGGLVGRNVGTVSDSFWDMETSGQAASAGGTGKTTAEMKIITTFSGVGWNIVGVANPSTRNPSYIWNIVDGQTYPFLSWQP